MLLGLGLPYLSLPRPTQLLPCLAACPPASWGSGAQRQVLQTRKKKKMMRGGRDKKPPPFSTSHTACTQFLPHLGS